MKLKRTSGKGQKWKKGQSCQSNPQNTKFRESAKGRFFQKLEGESGLTKDAIAQHNAALSNVSQEMEDLNIDADDLRSGGKSFNTFATSFTQCTIPAFERFFRNFSTTSETQTRMLAIHAAAQDYMTESGMPETSTSYFCSLVVSLEGIKDSEEDVTAALSLMARVIRRVHIEVLRSRFGDYAKLLDGIFTQYQNSSNNGLLTNAIGSMSVLLRAQEPDQWKHSYTQNLLQKLVAYTMHEKPKIRKSAQYNVAAILKGSSFMAKEEKKKTIHPGAAAVSEFCMAQLRAASEMGNTKRTLHILVFLRQVIMTFPKKAMKSSCECVLSLMQLGSSLINTCAMEALYSLLVSEPPSAIFPAETNSALISALTNKSDGNIGRAVSVIPGMNDAQSACAWITVLTVAHINLFKQSEDQGVKFITSWFKQLAPYWMSEHDEVQSKVYESFQALLEECISTCSKEFILANEGNMEAIFQAVEGGLSLQYQSTWDCVFKSLGCCFKVIGPHFPELMKPCVRSLAEFLDNPNVPHRGYLEQAIGAFVTSVGPKALLEVVPLEVTGDISKDEKYLWVLPILRRYVRNTQLAFFEDFFVHMAGKCFIILNSLKEKNQADSILAKTYHTVENQIWGLLPSFCDKATDVDVAMGNEKFARIMCDHIRLRDDTRISMMTALRTLINDNVENPGKLATYAKNYLPALFNIYLMKPRGSKGKSTKEMDTDEPTICNGHRLAAYSTIRAYLQIVPPPKCQEFLGLVMKKYNDETDDFKKQAFLDLARTFLPYIDSVLILRLFNKIKPILNSNKNRHVQKAAYRLLEELLSIRNEACQGFVTENLEELSELLLKSIAAAVPSSRASRLRCVRQILLQLKTDMGEEKLNEFLQQVVGESVMCCGKSMSDSTRKAAFLLISEVGATIQKHTGCSGEETVRRCIKLLLAGLTGSSMLAANSILAIISQTFQYKDIIPSDMLDLLIETMCVQLLCHSRDVVEASLSFIKSAFIIFPVPVMSNYVDTVMKAICNMIPDCQKKNRLKTRDIFDRLMRKHGADRIMALVPANDEILQKRLRNLRKIAARKKRNREENKRNADDSDDDDFESKALPASLDEILAEIDTEPDDDEDDEDSKKGKGKNKKKQIKKKDKGTWIKENKDEIVDLLDASSGHAIVSKRPILKPSRDRRVKDTDEEGGFKVDKRTGRLIITDDNAKEKESVSKIDFMEDVDEYLGLKEGALSGKIKNRKRMLSIGSDDDDDLFTPAGKVSGEGPNKEKKKKKPGKNTHEYGREFRSKKAGGDMMRKDKMSPFAYVQFSKDRLNKRKKAKFEGQFTSLVRGAKKGVFKGSKMKGRQRKQTSKRK